MVGNIVHGLVFEKVVEDRHCKPSFQGASISESFLNNLLTKGVRYVKILRVFKGRASLVYVSTVKQFLESESRYVNPDLEDDVQPFVKFVDMIPF